ncbi:MAG TPA: DUF1801 domain-containing protein [Lysobacter sp.]
MDRSSPGSIDEYIAAFPPEIRSILEKIRSVIRKTAPEAKEKISYQMPAFNLEGDLIYFAAFKQHIGLYPPVKGDEKLQEALAPYRGEKGNLKFPFSAPMPYELIERVVKARLEEHLERLAAKQGKKRR